MDEQAIIKERLKAGVDVVVNMRSCRTLEDFTRRIFQINAKTDLNVTTVVLKDIRFLGGVDVLTDMYDHQGQKLLAGVYTSRFTLPKVTNKSFGDYL
jgi:hypothetical protein